jgi:hypothetical protein
MAEKAGLRVDQQQMDRRIETFKELFRQSVQLQEQLGAEGKRYRTMEESLRNTLERIRVLELDGQRDAMAQVRKMTTADGTKISSAMAGGDAAPEALQRAKAEKERWEALFQDLNNLLIEEQQKGRDISNRLAMLRVGNSAGSPQMRKSSVAGRK